MAWLGIDFGSTSLSAALLMSNGVVEPLEFPMLTGQGSRSLPACLAFDEQGALQTVGALHREREAGQGRQTIVRFPKVLLGLSYDAVQDRIRSGDKACVEFRGLIERGPDLSLVVRTGSASQTPEQLVAHLLAVLKAEAERRVASAAETIEGVTIAVPGAWDDSRTRALQEAAKLAGLPTVTTLSEHAAIAFAVEPTDGDIMIVDIGFTATRSSIGRLTELDGEARFEKAAQQSQSQVGGLDLDYRILRHILETDAAAPRLVDLLPEMMTDRRQMWLLMDLIERAKIHAAESDAGPLTCELALGSTKKALTVSLDEKFLSDVARSVFVGNMAERGLQSIQACVEMCLLKAAGVDVASLECLVPCPDESAPADSYLRSSVLEAAGYDPVQITEAVSARVRGIEKVVLVGRTFSIDALRTEAQGLLGSVASSLGCVWVDDSSGRVQVMDGASRGAALSALGRVDTDATMPFPVSVLHWSRGRSLVIPGGLPFNRARGLVRRVELPVSRRSNAILIISEKGQGSETPRDWVVREHSVVVPEAGVLTLTLEWDAEHRRAGGIVIEGGGLPQPLRLAAASDIGTLGSVIMGAFREYLDAARDLRGRIQHVKGQVFEAALSDYLRKSSGAEVSAAGRDSGPPEAEEHHSSVFRRSVADGVEAMLNVPESQLSGCEALDAARLSFPRDEDIASVLDRGYLAVRDELSSGRWGIPDRARDVLELTFAQWVPVTEETLIGDCEWILEEFSAEHECHAYAVQLESQLVQLRSDRGNEVAACAVANALGTLADCLRHTGSPVMSKSIWLRVRHTMSILAPHRPGWVHRSQE